jgi:hypothetical protein
VIDKRVRASSGLVEVFSIGFEPLCEDIHLEHALELKNIQSPSKECVGNSLPPILNVATNS